jgi:hypothetical protein
MGTSSREAAELRRTVEQLEEDLDDKVFNPL